ncbi:MAG: MmgE/PrpD family protein [Rubrobacteraceae bacterium]|nr:MmgE/PrpD family protein [Rubrobacteraceae bacterium]
MELGSAGAPYPRGAGSSANEATRSSDAGPRTRRVAEFARGLRWDDIPADVQTQAIRCMLDLCGAALAGSLTKAAKIAASHALDAPGPGKCTVIGSSARSTPAGAALANGFAVSALDIDDGYRPVKGHPGSVVFPTVLACRRACRLERGRILDRPGGRL